MLHLPWMFSIVAIIEDAEEPILLRTLFSWIFAFSSCCATFSLLLTVFQPLESIICDNFWLSCLECRQALNNLVDIAFKVCPTKIFQPLGTALVVGGGS